MAILMNGPLDQLTHSIHSKTWIRSETKHRCVLLGDTQQFCYGFNRNYFRMRNLAKTVNILSHLILTSCLLKYYCIKSVSHCSCADIAFQGKIMAV